MFIGLVALPLGSNSRHVVDNYVRRDFMTVENSVQYFPVGVDIPGWEAPGKMSQFVRNDGGGKIQDTLLPRPLRKNVRMKIS